MWHVTFDMGHMTRDRWEEVNLLSKFSSLALTAYELQVTCGTWHVTGAGWTFSQNFSSLASSYDLGGKVILRSEGKEWIAESIDELKNDESFFL